MNANEYLTNPVIPKNFYKVKCLEVDFTRGERLPTIIIKLQVVPLASYGDAQNAILHVTLRGVANAQRMRDLFRQTFHVACRPTEAVGRFGSVLVDEAEFRGRRYSAVHFIRQNEIVRRQVADLERADRAGEIPWT